MRDQFHEVQRIASSDGYKMDPELKERVQELGRQNDEDYERLDALMEPLATGLTELGYSEREITK